MIFIWSLVSALHIRMFVLVNRTTKLLTISQWKVLSEYLPMRVNVRINYGEVLFVRH